MRCGARGVLAAATVIACTALAVPVAASTPPPKALLVDVAKGTLGGLALGQPAAAFIRNFGLPDYSGPIESPRTQEMLWTRSTSTKTAWAIVTLRGSAAQAVDTVRFGGLFRTAQGDRPGVSLAAFQRRWAAAKRVTVIVRKGIAVEYNVTVGRIVFAFDKGKTLRAVGLAPAGRRQSLCTILYVCVTSSLG
jgi:hypothetical protein